MEPRIEIIEEKQLIGVSAKMTLSENASKTPQLWRSLRPRQREISNRIPDQFYSLQTYGKVMAFNDFSPSTEMEKWALIPVSQVENLPEGMTVFTLPAGKYAVFIHRGPASTFFQTLQFIYTQWLPSSGYKIANRPHFEILSGKYQPNDPNAEEEVWIPIE